MRDGTRPLPVQFHDGICYALHGTPETSRSTFVLIHGLGNSLTFWTALFPLVSRLGCTIAFDLPGFGRSRAGRAPLSLQTLTSEVNAFLDELNVGQRTLVAHSLGGLVALSLAAARPGRVDLLVLISATPLTASSALVDPPVAMRTPGPAAALATQFAAAFLPMALPAEVLRRSGAARRVALAPFVHRPERLDGQLVYEALRHNSGKSIWRTLIEARRSSLPDLLRPPGCPVALINGDRDRLIPEQDVDQAARLLEAVDVHILADCGHWPQLESPEEVAEIVRRSTGDA